MCVRASPRAFWRDRWATEAVRRGTNSPKWYECVETATRDYVILSRVALYSSQLRNAPDSPAIALANTYIVIPTFNERSNISKLVETILSLYPEIHILVVDDHSPDGTSDAVRGLQVRHSKVMLLERMQDHGFGPSYRDGFRLALAESDCDAIITMDADFSHDPAQVGPMVEKLAGCDVVVGSRYAPGGGVANWRLRRRVLSRGANFYVRAVLGLPVHDATAGFLCLRPAAIRKLPLHEAKSNGYAFLVEMKYLLQKAGCRMMEHPILFDERREGESKMSMGKIWESVWLPWRIRRRTGGNS
jgi:dolichol-phosphate mannosyltransferase